jgi:plasmid stabilization system protein ParE
MKRLRYVPSADDDLARLFRWYWKKGSTQPRVIFAEVTRLTDKIVLNPHQYAKVDRCPATRDIRITQSAKRRIVVIYETTATDVVILNLSHKAAKRRPWPKRLNEV